MTPLPARTEASSVSRMGLDSLAPLASAILLLSTVPTVTKYIFQHSQLDPPGLALVRVAIGFCFLFGMTVMQDRRGLCSLAAADAGKLSLMGLLGVGSYVIAAWGLQLTSVTHYILIYSLLSPVTALLSMLVKRARACLLVGIGIGISLLGEGIAMSTKLEHVESDFGMGDLLILVFTIMMALHLVLSANIVKRFGAMTANTVMFGSSTAFLTAIALVQSPWPSEEPSSWVAVSALYVGVATASVFLLRYRVLRTISPATVAVYQNVTPAGGILFAHVFLGEPLFLSTITGGAIILLGAEVVRRAHLPVPVAPLGWGRWLWGATLGGKSPH